MFFGNLNRYNDSQFPQRIPDTFLKANSDAYMMLYKKVVGPLVLEPVGTAEAVETTPSSDDPMYDDLDMPPYEEDPEAEEDQEEEDEEENVRDTDLENLAFTATKLLHQVDIHLFLNPKSSKSTVWLGLQQNKMVVGKVFHNRRDGLSEAVIHRLASTTPGVVKMLDAYDTLSGQYVLIQEYIASPSVCI